MVLINIQLKRKPSDIHSDEGDVRVKCRLERVGKIQREFFTGSSFHLQYVSKDTLSSRLTGSGLKFAVLFLPYHRLSTEMFPLLISLSSWPQGHGCFSGLVRQDEKYRPQVLDHSEKGGIWNGVVRFGVF